MSVGIKQAIQRRLGDDQRQRWLWALGSAIPVLGLPLLVAHARSRRTWIPPLYGLTSLGMLAFISASFVVVQPKLFQPLGNRGAQPLVALLVISGFACGHKLGQDKAAIAGRRWLELDH